MLIDGFIDMFKKRPIEPTGVRFTGNIVAFLERLSALCKKIGEKSSRPR